MAKRHPSLVPLAREHHDGLLLAIRLQQGTNALLRLWSHDPTWQANHVVEFSNRYLLTHFEAEEKALFPVASEIPRCKPIVNELVSEHQALRDFVTQFHKPERLRLEEDLRSFGALLEAHIRKEDRVLFLGFEEEATDEMLREVQTEMKRYYPDEPS